MKKKILILCAVAISCSCASRKVNRDKTEEKTNEKQTEQTTTDTEEQSNSKINFEYKISDYSFEPIDNTKPYFIGSKKYENVKIITKEDTGKYSAEMELLKKQTEQRFLEYEKQIEVLKNTKVIEKTASIPWGLIFSLLLLVAILIAWNKLKKKL